MNAPMQPPLFDDQVLPGGQEPPEAGYSVELGGQFFSQEQWEVIQAYAKGHAISAVQEDRKGPLRMEPEELIFQAGLGMDFLLEKQETIEKGWDRLVNPSDPEAVSAYIRDVVLCATDELHEVLGEVNWKPWKNNRGIKNMENYREEMADVLHFILDLYLAAGLTGRDIVLDYLSKHYENLYRMNRTEYKES